MPDDGRASFWGVGCLRAGVVARTTGMTVVFALASCQAGSRDRPGIQRMILSADLRIGSETAGPEYLFTNLTKVVPTDDAIFVLQGGIPEIRVYGLDGRYRRTIGRAGAGPGEFDGLEVIGVLGDTLWAVDGNLRRITYFDSATNRSPSLDRLRDGPM